MTLLADAAPSGAGLGIVAVILLVFLAIVVALLVLPIRWFVKRRRAAAQEEPGDA